MFFLANPWNNFCNKKRAQSSELAHKVKKNSDHLEINTTSSKLQWQIRHDKRDSPKAVVGWAEDLGPIQAHYRSHPLQKRQELPCFPLCFTPGDLVLHLLYSKTLPSCVNYRRHGRIRLCPTSAKKTCQFICLCFNDEHLYHHPRAYRVSYLLPTLMYLELPVCSRANHYVLPSKCFFLCYLVLWFICK